MKQDPLDLRLAHEPPMAWPAPPAAWPWVLLGVILLAVLGWAVLQTLRRRAPRPGAPPRSRAPEKTARLALDRLRREGRVASGRAEPFYRALSSIVRRYLEDRFGVCAPRLTTEEFLSSPAIEDVLPTGLRARIAAFLRVCDLVKFARSAPGMEEREQAWHAAVAIVTWPRGDPPVKGGL